MKKIVFFTGKGGSGKTSLSLALAYYASSKPDVFLKTEVVSLDPAPNLKHMADLSEITKSPRLKIKEILPERLVKRKIDDVVESFLENFPHMRVLTSRELASAIRESPGAPEMVLYEETIRTIHTSKAEMIIFDMPPTGQALEILNYPFKRLRWLEILLKIRKSYHEKKKAIESIKGIPAGQNETNEVKKDPVLETLQKILKETQKSIKLLQDSATIFLIHNPDEVSSREALQAKNKLKKLGLTRIVLIENRGKIIPELWERKPFAPALLKAGEKLASIFQNLYRL